MFRIRWAIVGVAMALQAGCGSNNQPAEGGGVDRLEGSWEVTMVQRDGEADPLQLGAQMTFTGNAVTFQPKAMQVVDYTS